MWVSDLRFEIRKLKDTYLDVQRDRERPALQHIHSYLSKDIILEWFATEFGITIDRATGTDRHILMTMLYKYAGMKNSAIGNLLGCDYSTVSQGRTRLLAKADKDKTLKQRIEAIESKLSCIKI
jgi:putative transposase